MISFDQSNPPSGGALGGHLASEVDSVVVGRVVAVSGSQVVILLTPEAAVAADESSEVQIGAMLRMRTQVSTVFGLVSGLSIPIPGNDPSVELKIVELELVGEIPLGRDSTPRFHRGVSVFPALGASVATATRTDLTGIYMRDDRQSVRIGSIHQDPRLPANILTDDLLGKHFAVLGTTGSGKSCAVALILNAILNNHPNGHVILLDPHSEYASAFQGRAELLDASNMDLPYWLLNFEELVGILQFGDMAEHEAESAILYDIVLAAKRSYAGDSPGTDFITVDTPVPYRLGDVHRLLDEAMGRLDKPQDSAPYLRIKGRLNALQTDRRYAFMFPSALSLRDNMTSILARMLRIPVGDKPVTIIDLSGLPSETLNVLVSLLSRMAFDFALWAERSVPILLVCEEAHRYAPLDTSRGFEPTKRELSRIAKEGRKYGVSLCVVSQRPSELAAGMLSQCNTIFAMRLSNQHDQDFVRSAMPESGHGLLEFLPSLGNAQAVVVGEGVAVPMRLVFDQLPEESRPSRGGASFAQSWSDDQPDRDFVANVVDRWRRQIR
ncbi:MAG: DUF87 domain-containing protein [Rhodospirillaceae bacterium]|nr:DUF87 domain-containing protein [Rhodospirillaceae bacterium]